MYRNGLGVEQNYIEALNWYRKAADQGNVYAQSNLGDMCYNGYGVEQNYAEAVGWYKKAADKGYAPAMNSLGIRMLSIGWGTFTLTVAVWSRMTQRL